MSGDSGQTRQQFSSDVMRLLIGSALAALMFAGGVYWLRSLPASGVPQQDAGASIQVRLLPSEEPTPFPTNIEPPARLDTTSEADGKSNSKSEVDQEEPNVVVAPASPSMGRPANSRPRLTPKARTEISSEMALRFQQALLAHIARFKRYPEQALKQPMRGTVIVVFQLRRDGSVMDAWVQSSSGEPLLDREAIATIDRAVPLPRIPSGMPEQMRVLLPVAFDAP